MFSILFISILSAFFYFHEKRIRRIYKNLDDVEKSVEDIKNEVFNCPITKLTELSIRISTYTDIKYKKYPFYTKSVLISEIIQYRINKNI
jgi:hypothetical protein